jgi:hypothetical protein
MIEKINDAETAEDLRERVEQLTGIDFEAAQPYDMAWGDWKNLVHLLETEVGENADNSGTEGGTE